MKIIVKLKINVNIMNKIYIYEAVTILKDKIFKNTIVDHVRLTRPEGLEEHIPNVGDIVNLYSPRCIYHITRKIVGKLGDYIYIVDSEPVNGINCNIKIENLKEEGIECLLDLPKYVNSEIEELLSLTNENVNLNEPLCLCFDNINKDGFEEVFKYIIKEQAIKSIKNQIKDNYVWVEPSHGWNIEVYTNEPTIQEVIDKEVNPDDIRYYKFKGIIEKEVHLYRICIRTNIYKA